MTEKTPSPVARALEGLESLRRLLLKYGYSDEAAIVEELAFLEDMDAAKFRNELADSGDVWGGMGSLVDASLKPLPGQSPEEFEADSEAFDRAFIDLGEAVSDLGLPQSSAARHAGSLTEHWLLRRVGDRILVRQLRGSEEGHVVELEALIDVFRDLQDVWDRYGYGREAHVVGSLIYEARRIRKRGGAHPEKDPFLSALLTDRVALSTFIQYLVGTLERKRIGRTDIERITVSFVRLLPRME